MVTPMDKPVSQPCLRNQDPIMRVLSKHFDALGRVLELGCGTAQHAVYCCQHLPHLNWLPTEHPANLQAAQLWVNEANLKNLNPPQPLDINRSDWPVLNNEQFDYAYCANLLHFVPETSAANVFSGVSRHLKKGGKFAIYGPININGFTSEGNVNLDAWLKQDIHPKAGIKELDQVEHWANQSGMSLIANESMPANNHILLFRKNRNA